MSILYGTSEILALKHEDMTAHKVLLRGSHVSTVSTDAVFKTRSSHPSFRDQETGVW